MKVQLLVSSWSPSCQRAREVWRELADEEQFTLDVMDVAQKEGGALMSRLKLTTIPALLIDGKLIAIGVQSKAEARSIVNTARRQRH